MDTMGQLPASNIPPYLVGVRHCCRAADLACFHGAGSRHHTAGDEKIEGFPLQLLIKRIAAVDHSIQQCGHEIETSRRCRHDDVCRQHFSGFPPYRPSAHVYRRCSSNRCSQDTRQFSCPQSARFPRCSQLPPRRGQIHRAGSQRFRSGGGLPSKINAFFMVTPSHL